MKELTLKAVEQVRKKDYREATIICNKVLAIDPKHGLARILLRQISESRAGRSRSDILMGPDATMEIWQKRYSRGQFVRDLKEHE